MEAENVSMDQEKSDTQINLKKKLAEPTVLDSFTKLTSNKEKIRLSAGVKLIKHLIQDSDKIETEQNYALDRLVRGVGSSKLNSKTGFYTVLVSFLQNTTAITVGSVIQAINKHLSTGGSNSKSENADICTGQILATGALIHSGKFYTASEEEQKKVVEILITAGNKRSYLSLAAYTFLIEVLNKCEKSQFQNIIWPVIKPEISKPWQEQNLDTIYFLNVARSLYPNVIKEKYLNKILNAPEIIHEDSMAHHSEILLNVPTFASIKHPIYEMIGKQLAKSEYLQNFCSEVDVQLKKSTRNKHLVTTHLFTIILQNMTENFSKISDILTNQYIIVTLNTYKNTRPKGKDDFLVYMNKFFEAFENTLKKEEVTTKTKILILKKLLFYPGILIFEKITRTKLVQHITQNLNEDGVKKLAKIYKEVILATKPRVVNENRTETWFNTDRVYAANLLVKLMGHSAMVKENDWKLEQAKFLLKLGLFKTVSESNVGVELAASIKECFYRILDLKFPKLEDLRNFLSSLIHHIDEEIFQSNNLDQLRTSLPEENGLGVWNNMIKLVKKLEKKSKKTKVNDYVIPVFHTLLLQMGMQLLSDFNMAESSLKELHSCYERLDQKKSQGDENEEPAWIEVVIDLFLSLLSQNSHLLRSVIGCVFPYLCPHLSIQSIHQILEVLDPKNEENPLTKLKKGEDESNSESDESEAKSGEENSDSDDESAESVGSDLEDALDEEQESATDKLRMAVRNALHQNGYQTDDESVDLDDIDEEEGRKLDEALADAFRNMRKSKGKNAKQSKDDKTVTHFRVRVLDLIVMYLDSDPSLHICLEIAIMLLQVLEFSIRDTHQKPLEDRTRNCLKKLTSNKKFSTVNDVTEEILLEMLNSFIEKGSKSAFIYQDMEKEISECVLFIIRAHSLVLKSNITSNTPKKLKKKLLNSPIIETLKGALQNFFVKRDSLIPIVLFKRILESNWEGNFALLPFLVEYSFDNEIRPFRRSQALELLKIFYSNHRLRQGDIVNFKKITGPYEIKLNKNTLELLQELNANPKNCKVKEKFFYLLLTLLFMIRNSGENSNFEWEKIGSLVRDYRSKTSLSKDAKTAYSKLCHILKIPAAVKMQLNPNTQNGHDDKEDTQSETSQKEEKADKKKKKPINKNKAKLRKETQELRMKANSEGLENIDFCKNVSLLTENISEVVNGVSDSESQKMDTLEENGHDESIEKSNIKLKKRKNKNKNNHLEGDSLKKKKKRISE